MLAILFRMVADCPVIVAANREEHYDRPGTPPESWGASPRFVAGRDTRAGGAWLGVNECGVLIAVTNRPKAMPTPASRSRGLLCRDLLACPTARTAHDRALGEFSTHGYAGCNVLAIDAEQAWVIHAENTLRPIALSPGPHVLTAHDVDQTTDARTDYAMRWLRSQSATEVDDWVALLSELCRSHETADRPPVCLHAVDRGTVSSSIIALPGSPGGARWLHAQGSPCTHAFVDYSQLLGEMPGG
jgi:uncharacterized protein with NRDE domain